jgi:hypothetical protein
MNERDNLASLRSPDGRSLLMVDIDMLQRDMDDSENDRIAGRRDRRAQIWKWAPVIIGSGFRVPGPTIPDVATL